MRAFKRVVTSVLLGSVMALLGCDQQRIAKLEEGVATEADVRREFGEPAAVYAESDGSRTLEFPRQPQGQVNYMITIGSDGKMSALRQVLKPAEFSKVAAGMDKVEVRRLLGKPAKTVRFDLRPDEEHWDWRWADNQQPKLFTVTFDRDGKVIRAAATDDPDATKGSP